MRTTLWIGFTVLCLASCAEAAIHTYEDRVSWTAAIGSPTGAENFDGFAADVVLRNNVVPIQGGTITASGGDHGPTRQTIDVPPFSSPSLNGSAYVYQWVNPFTKLTFTYDTPINAWAFDFGMPEIYSAKLDVFDSDNTLLGSVPLSNNAGAAQAFLGFVVGGGEASRVVLTTPANQLPSIGMLLDNIEFSTVPEPASLWLGSLATLSVFAGRRRP